MLSLTRKKGESIIISDNIEIMVVSVQGEQVKLGITAPKSIPIYRREIYDQIESENKQAVIEKDLNIADISKHMK